MAGDLELRDHCIELLAALGRPRARRMFGGHGLYVDEFFIALIADGQLYLKADDAARPAFERAGCRPFGYTRRDDRRAVMAYWSAPDEAMESAAQMLPWARLALASALRAASSSTRPPRHSSAATAPRTGAAPNAPARRKRGA